MGAEVRKWGFQVLEIIGRKYLRKCGGAGHKLLISLSAEAEAEVHTTYGGSLAANTPLRIVSGGHRG